MRKFYILIAEDDADDRFLLKTAFEESGYKNTLKFVENGVELIKHLKEVTQRKNNEEFPGFILLDLNMPKKDGREVLKEIKENKVLKKIPVIVFTTTKNENEISKCYELGANSYVVKPLVFDELVHIIKALYSYWFQISTIAG
ncbi:MAG TPA: response regulator [Chitinophagaceae bacterium]